jgi:predicted phosphodiesterase
VRYLILSDIHSNLLALDAVLANAVSYDLVWCLGDVIGYGPQPNECIDRLRGVPHVCVAGNHDWAAVGRLDTSVFNPDALRACLWTREQLLPSSWEFIECLPERHQEDRFLLVHGSPRYPIWEYLTRPSQAAENLSYFEATVCLHGHTHKPIIFRCAEPSGRCEIVEPSYGELITLGDERWLINPGGVGQPRDGDPRASYVLFDSEEDTIEYRRVSYPIEETQDLMLSLGLPPRLAWRLSMGW